jgi:hypothetical protein
MIININTNSNNNSQGRRSKRWPNALERWSRGALHATPQC